MAPAARHNVISTNPADEGASASDGGDCNWIPISSESQARTIVSHSLKSTEIADLDRRFAEQFNDVKGGERLIAGEKSSE